MKLASFVHGDAPPAIGVVQGERIFPVEGISDMNAVAADYAAHKPALERALGGGGLPLAEMRLLPPITRPGKIMAIGLNYADHILESGSAPPEQQTWFCKQISSLNGPYDSVEVPKVSAALDYEAELVVVIGKGGRHIARSEAAAHVLGYCVGNDVSVRDWQLATSQWVIGKSFDTHAPIGPWVTTSDEVSDPHGLDIRCLVNGEQRQGSNTRQLVFDVWAQIEHLSQAMTLEPGDLIFTGTPGGVGGAATPPFRLKDGDVVRVEIDRLGHIENVCRDEI